MRFNFDLIDNFEEKIITKEKICQNVREFNNYEKSSENFVLYVNIRSMNKNFVQLEVLLKSLEIKPFAIVCVETWQVKNEQLYNLPGYNLYYNEGDVSIADGVIVFVRDSIEHEAEIIEVDKLKILNIKLIMGNGKSFELSSLYRSHEIQKLEFIKSFEKFLQSKKDCTNHYIVGDYNIDLLELDVVSQVFLETIFENGYINGYHEVTRPSMNNNGGTCIDNVLIKSENMNVKTYTLKSGITDHYILLFKINKQFIYKSKPENTFIDYNKLKRAARTVNWSEIEILSNVNKATDLLIEKILYCIECSKTGKKRVGSKKDRNGLQKPW